jgi:branched-subunit amino acid transport protein AzlD
VASTTYILSAIAVAATITFVLRAGPFAVIAPLRSSRVIRDLARWMPGGLMAILLAYLLRGKAHESAAHAALAVVALAVVVSLHWWRANALLSILAGTALYVAGVSLIFQ